jgi:hypothetical protein
MLPIYQVFRTVQLVRRSYWLDMNDRPLVLVMTQGSDRI